MTSVARMPRWPEATADHYRQLGVWTDETFPEFLLNSCARYASRPAVTARSAAPGSSEATLQWETLSYAQLLKRSRAGAAALQAQGIEPGDRVLLHIGNTIEYPVGLWAVLLAGALPVFTLPAHGPAELGPILRRSGARAIITAPSSVTERQKVEALARGQKLTLIDASEAGLNADAAAFSAPQQESQDCHPAESLAFYQLSGGTTGIPKLIGRTHADYLYSVRRSVEVCGLDERTTLLVVLPVAHNFPMSSPGILGVLHGGGHVVLAPDPSPRTAFDLIERHCVTMTSLVPSLLQAWLASSIRQRFDLSSVETIQVGGAKLADSVAVQVGPVLGARLQQVFGMAEGLVCYTRDDDPDELVTSTQGCPMSVHDEIRIVDDDDQEVTLGESGHLLVRGPYTIRGYLPRAVSEEDPLGEEPANATSFTPEGFYRTGDIVRRLPTGHLIVEGRAGDHINRSGEKISAEEVEGHLLDLPEVLDAAVVGIEDEVLGERIVAFLVAVPSFHSHAEDPSGQSQINQYLAQRGLAAFKRPDRIRWVPRFPVTGVGKISRRELRRRLRELHGDTSPSSSESLRTPEISGTSESPSPPGNPSSAGSPSSSKIHKTTEEVPHGLA